MSLRVTAKGPGPPTLESRGDHDICVRWVTRSLQRDQRVSEERQLPLSSAKDVKCSAFERRNKCDRLQ